MGVKQLASCSVTLVLFSLLALSVSAMPLSRKRSLSTIKALNLEGPYLGLITVFSSEEDAFFSTGAFKPHPTHPFVDLSGRTFRVGKVAGKKVIYVRCGIGMVNAAAATQQMLDLFDIVGIIHFGIAGNANNSMSIEDVAIPKQFAHTGIWDWVNPNGTIDSVIVTELDFGNYNVPERGINLLGRIGFRYEEFYSESGKPNTFQRLFWAHVSKDWLRLAAHLQGMELEQCVNSTSCLPEKPQVVVGLKGSTGNAFVDNAAYRNFLFKTY